MPTARRHHPREPSQTGIGPLRLRQEATAHARPLNTHPVLAHGQRQITGKALARVGFIDEAHHTMATFTGSASDVIPGTVFAVTSEEIRNADAYEVAAVKRVAVVLQSGRRAWAYVDSGCTIPPSE